MNFLYLLEDIRVPVLNEFMLLITRLGEETAFLAVALILFWCVDKKMGYYVMSVGFLGTISSQFLKLACRVPRPWVLDPEFTILEQAREAASGYSFPSGHSQSAVGTFGGMAATMKNKWLKGLFIAISILVPLSRMYIGVHTPADVLVGSGISLILIFALRPVVYSENPRSMKILLASMIGVALLYLAYVEFWPFPADMDAHNLESGYKNAYTLLGALVGITIVYAVDEKKINFQVQAPWWAQILKVVLGLGLVLLVKEGMKSPLEALFAGHMASRAVRYCLIVLVAGLVWPLSFRWFAKLGKNKRGNQ